MSSLQEFTAEYQPIEFEDPDALSEETLYGLVHLGSPDPDLNLQAEQALTVLPPDMSPGDIQHIYTDLTDLLRENLSIRFRFGGQVNRHARESLRLLARHAESEDDQITYHSVQEWQAARQLSTKIMRRLLGKIATYV